MAKKKRTAFFQKALNLSKISILIAKMGKPISSNLTFLRTRKFKKLKVHKHYNHAFIQEYQFSPSSTPLFHYHSKPFKKKACRDIYSMLLCRCSGNLSLEAGESEGKEEGDYVLEAAPPVIDNSNAKELPELSESGEEDDSVDRRAEMFIQRFYEEMRLQKQESVMKYKEMLDRGCS